MSQISISPSHKKQSSWKVSEQSRIFNKEASVIGQSFHLPERFSPSKKGPNQSRLFNTSMQKLKFSRISGQKDVALTPRGDKVAFGINQGHSILKESNNFGKESPKKQVKFQNIDINRKDSGGSISSDQLKTIRHEMMKSLIQQYEINRRMILQVKEEVNRFKVLILQQINIQRSVTNQFMQKIEDYLQKSNAGVSMGLKDIIENQKSTVQSMVSHLNYVSNIESNIKKQEQLFSEVLPVKDINLKGGTAKVAAKIQGLQTTSIDPKQQKNQLLTPFIPTQMANDPCHNKEVANQNNSKRGSPHLQKCNHIVQTITILNEINDCPIKSLNKNPNTKSVQKLAIEEYKQRIMAITKSNDNLIREKSRQKTVINEDKLKVKGNFKLQKFYNAIQKLKQQVKEIKNINEMKQTRPSGIVKYT